MVIAKIFNDEIVHLAQGWTEEQIEEIERNLYPDPEAPFGEGCLRQVGEWNGRTFHSTSADGACTIEIEEAQP